MAVARSNSIVLRTVGLAPSHNLGGVDKQPCCKAVCWSDSGVIYILDDMLMSLPVVDACLMTGPAG